MAVRTMVTTQAAGHAGRSVLGFLAASVFAAAPALAQSFPADDAWRAFPCGNAPMRDAVADHPGAPRERDLVGTAPAPAGLRAADADFLYLRMRLGDDPRQGRTCARRPPGASPSAPTGKTMDTKRCWPWTAPPGPWRCSGTAPSRSRQSRGSGGQPGGGQLPVRQPRPGGRGRQRARHRQRLLPGPGGAVAGFGDGRPHPRPDDRDLGGVVQQPRPPEPQSRLPRCRRSRRRAPPGRIRLQRRAHRSRRRRRGHGRHGRRGRRTGGAGGIQLEGGPGCAFGGPHPGPQRAPTAAVALLLGVLVFFRGRATGRRR